MGNNNFDLYKHLIEDSIDIKENIIFKTMYPTIIMDRDFKIIFVNEIALKLHDIPLNKMFMKNYFGVFCKSKTEYDEFIEFYENILKKKKPVYVNNEQNNSYVMVFPILSPTTGEIEYFYNIYIVEEFYLTSKQKEDLKFNHDYIYFSHQLSVLLEVKDKYTATHSTNVSKYSELLGIALGMEGIELEKLKLAANLHDIGKVGVPNYILNKSEKLSDDENINIKDHVYYSGKILEVFKELNEIREVGLYHHEMYNGKGYPEGLVGRNIPLYARIISITNEFDKMITDRPYRKAMSIDEAISELKENKDIQFDPFLVDKFLNIDLKKVLTSNYEPNSQYNDQFSIPPDVSKHMRKNIDQMLMNINPSDIIVNMVDYGFYGLIIAKDLKYDQHKSVNRFDILYKSNLVDKLIYDGFLENNWEMCLKKKRFLQCNHCPVDSCLNLDSTFFKRSKLTNNDAETRYLNTILHPVHNTQTNETYIIEILNDETISVVYGNIVATEFFNFVDNLSKIFSEQYREFSIIYREMRDLANWIASKVGISEHKTELLNKALSICDLGIIALCDSNEFSFESLSNLRTNKKHIEIIFNMITKLRTFDDIKDIVLYHHTNYNDTTQILSGDEVPIQSYIIGTTDYLLTAVVLGENAEGILSHLETLSGNLASPLICKSLLYGETRIELIEKIESIISTIQ